MDGDGVPDKWDKDDDNDGIPDDQEGSKLSHSVSFVFLRFIKTDKK